MRRSRPRITDKNSGTVEAREKFTLLYKGSSIEISSQDHEPAKWNVSFDILAMLYRRPTRVGFMMRSGFITRNDALDWATKEIDGFVK